MKKQPKPKKLPKPKQQQPGGNIFAVQKTPAQHAGGNIFAVSRPQQQNIFATSQDQSRKFTP